MADRNKIACAGTAGGGGPRFEPAAKTLMGALASSTPLKLPDCEQLFAEFNQPLKADARNTLGLSGVPSLEAAVTEALERFYRRMLLEGGFADFLKSGEQAFWHTAQKAMQAICMEMMRASSTGRPR